MTTKHIVELLEHVAAAAAPMCHVMLIVKRNFIQLHLLLWFLRSEWEVLGAQPITGHVREKFSVELASFSKNWRSDMLSQLRSLL